MLLCFPFDFTRKARIHGDTVAMDEVAMSQRQRGEQMTVTGCLRAISARLTEVGAIGKAAVTCAESGSEDHAVRIAFDLEEPVQEANMLLKAACLMQRICEGREVEIASG
jgi:hypothetical protein